MITHERIATVINSVAPKYDIQSVYLFGSYATGKADENSDCDFRVVGGNFRSLLDLGGLYCDLEEALGMRIDIVMSDSISEKFYNNIKNHEVLLYDKI